MAYVLKICIMVLWHSEIYVVWVEYIGRLLDNHPIIETQAYKLRDISVISLGDVRSS